LRRRPPLRARESFRGPLVILSIPVTVRYNLFLDRFIAWAIE
jgi:hypothetical protein